MIQGALPPRVKQLAIDLITGNQTESAAMIEWLAKDQEPRPGRWYEGGCHVVLEDDGKRTFIVDDVRKERGDGRLLDQVATDALIVIEIHRKIAPCSTPVMLELNRRLPWPLSAGWLNDPAMFSATAQRGGIHADPFARALALALWGNRDVGITREAT